MSKIITEREVLADQIFILIQLFSSSLFLISGLGGWIFFNWKGLFIGVTIGLVLGNWMKRSYGKRGKGGSTGFYVRMRERADGSRAGLLEKFIEWIRGSSFTEEKCRRIVNVYDEAIQQLKSAVNEEGRMNILISLSESTKEISYEKISN